MNNTILCIPADKSGNKLFIKDLREEKGRVFAKYKSTYNDVPFQETELFGADSGINCIITGDDGTVLWRFSIQLLEKLK